MDYRPSGEGERDATSKLQRVLAKWCVLAARCLNENRFRMASGDSSTKKNAGFLIEKKSLFVVLN
jgi:hypothetical protein